MIQKNLNVSIRFGTNPNKQQLSMMPYVGDQQQHLGAKITFDKPAQLFFPSGMVYVNENQCLIIDGEDTFPLLNMMQYVPLDNLSANKLQKILQNTEKTFVPECNPVSYGFASDGKQFLSLNTVCQRYHHSRNYQEIITRAVYDGQWMAIDFIGHFEGSQFTAWEGISSKELNEMEEMANQEGFDVVCRDIVHISDEEIRETEHFLRKMQSSFTEFCFCHKKTKGILTGLSLFRKKQEYYAAYLMPYRSPIYSHSFWFCLTRDRKSYEAGIYPYQVNEDGNLILRYPSICNKWTDEERQEVLSLFLQKHPIWTVTKIRLFSRCR